MIDASTLHQIGRQYIGATCHERSRLVSEYAARSAVTAATVRRQLAAIGYKVPRKERADKGATRVGEQRIQAAMAVAKLKAESRGVMPTWVAIDMAKRKGMIGAEVNEKTLLGFTDRMIATRNISMDKDDRAADPARRIDWKYPGHCLQVDSTNCAQWFLRESSGVIRFADKCELYHNKPGQSAPIIRYLGVDAYSGCFRVRYYQTHAERADDTIDFLLWLFAPSSGDAARLSQDPLHGIPEVIVFDRGSGNVSAATRNLLAALDCEARYHRPRNSRAKGCVERHHGLWGRWFESQLKIDPAGSVEELNERAAEMCRKINSGRMLTGIDKPRAEVYSTGRAALRLPPPREVCIEAAHSAPETRRVSNEMWIELEGRKYYVGTIDAARPGDKVQVRKLVLDADETERPVRIQRLDERGQAVGDSYRVCAMVREGGGRWSEPALYRNKALDSRDASDAETSAALDAVLVPRETARADADLPAMPAVPAATMTMMPSVQQPKISRTTALLRLRQMVGRELSDGEYAALNWGEWVDQADIGATARRMASAPASAERMVG